MNIKTVWKAHRVIDGNFNLAFIDASSETAILEIIESPKPKRKIRKKLREGYYKTALSKMY